MHSFKFVFKRTIYKYVRDCFMFLRLLLISYKVQEISIFNQKKVLFLQYILPNNYFDKYDIGYNGLYRTGPNVSKKLGE